MSPQISTGDQKPLSEAARLSGVVMEPGKAFADIAARPRFWTPLALIIVVALAFTFAVGKRIGWETVMRTQMEKNSQIQKLPVEQRERMISQQTKVMAVAGYPIAVVAPIFMVVACSAVYLFVFRILMSADVSFKQMIAVYAYASIPGIISSLLALLVMFLKQPEDFDIQNPLAFNLGAFLPEGTSKFLVSVGTSIDLFMLWALALIVVGVRAAAPRISTGGAAAGVLVPWLLWVAGKSAWTAKFG